MTTSLILPATVALPKPDLVALDMAGMDRLFPARPITVRLDPPAVAMVWSRPGQPHRSLVVPEVELAPGEALVAVELATICGSDQHTCRGDRAAPAPLVLGHEQVGTVVAANHAVTVAGTPLAVGQRVVWSLVVSCADCPTCARGLPQKCRVGRRFGHEPLTDSWQLSGGFASHVQLPRGTAIVPVPEDLPAELLAPASCGTATACAALDAAGASVAPGEVALVSGAGLIGLTATALLASRGMRVVVSDPDPARRELASRFGAGAVADPCVPPAAGDSLATVLKGFGPPLLAVEASGAPTAVDACLAALDTGGVAVLVGSASPAGTVPLDPERLVRGLLTVRGVHNYPPYHLVEAVDFLVRDTDPGRFAGLVGASYPLTDLDAALAAAEGGPVRVAVRP